jgi:type I restriction enzyme, S subunit
MSSYQLPKGYKQTDAGVIPEDWDVKLLCNIAEIRSGIAKNSNASVRDPILVHYLRVANVQDGFLDLTEMSKIEVSRNDLKRYTVLPGDVLMNEGGDLDKLGRGSIWRGEFNPCIHQNHVFIVRSGSSSSSEYLNIWTSGVSARRYFLVAGKQTTNLATINKTALGELPVALPSLTEQRSIATALSDMDELLGGLDRLITKKRNIKQSAMQQLLTGKIRLPGFCERKGYKQTDVKLIPDDWQISKVGKVCDFIVPGRNKPKLFDGDIPWITTPDLEEGETVSFSRIGLCISPQEAKAIGSKIVPPGSVLMSCAGELGIVALTQNEMVVNQQLHVFIPTEQINGKFLLNFLAYKKDQIANYGTKTAVPYLNKTTCNSIPIILPPIPEQTAIASILSDMDTEIAILEQRRNKTRDLKQAMMQELLTGRIRLL